jgi:hypothetical protein
MGTSSLTLPLVIASGEVIRGAAAKSEWSLALPISTSFVEPIHTTPLIGAQGVVHAGQEGQSHAPLPYIVGEALAATSPRLSSEHTLGVYSASGEAITQRVGESAQSLQIGEADGTAITSRLGESLAVLPLPSAQAQGDTEQPERVVSLQAIALFDASAEARTSRTSDSQQTIASIVAQGLAYAQRVATSGQTLPLWQTDASAQGSRSGDSILTLPLLQAGASAQRPHEAASELVLPLLQADPTFAGGALATSILALPVWMAFGSAQAQTPQDGVEQGAATKSKTFAVHAQTYAQSRDAGLAFNSAARLGTLFIGANEQGLYLLGAYTDDGEPIHALAKFPAPDDEGALLRRVESLVLGYRCDGDLRLSVQVEDEDAHEYIMESTGHLQCHPSRVKVGKGTKGRYWTLTLENVDGSDFATDKVDIDWNTLSRRTR